MSSSETKLCRYCGEEIRAIAIKCKHCQSMLDGSGQEGDSVTAGGGRSSSGAGSSPGSAGGDNANYKRLAPGVVINRYELQQLLGKGGMGEVYLAEHTYTGQKVALKAVWPNLMASEGPRKRFLQEGRVLAKLKHPNIVGLTDFFEEDGRFFLVMEYVEGETLSAYLHRASGRGEAIPFSEFARVVGGVLKGLSHAHAQTPYVVHRDIKPANVMLAKDGRVVLMDFGIARVAGGEKITSTAGVVGTYEYMSPEQVSGQAITPATDVYAVGILAYELLTGDVPFPQKSDSGYEAMDGHRHKAPPPIQERRPDCPPALAAWVEKALAKEPGQRYRDAGEMLGALGELNRGQSQQAPVGSEAPGPGPGPGPMPLDGSKLEAKYEGQNAAGSAGSANGRGRWKWWGVGALLLGLAVLGGFVVWRGSGMEAPGLQWVYSAPASLYFTRTEVTVAQYRACVEAGACRAANYGTNADSNYCNYGHSDRDQHPMNCLNWYGADQFCTWVGGRLPTEDEWYAEASNYGTREYPWGDTEVTCDRAIWGDGSNTDGCGQDHTWPVCSRLAGNSVSGLCDMSGSVWERTLSLEGSGLVLRGGAWDSGLPANLQASALLRYDSGSRDNDFGVRCVRVSQ